jgi:hypothetical protein
MPWLPLANAERQQTSEGICSMSRYDQDVSELVETIKSNPKSVIMLDNDCWYLLAADDLDGDCLAQGDLDELWTALAQIANLKIEPV